LRAKGLATTPQHVLLSAAGAFKDKMYFVHRIWQTDFTYFKVGVGMVITAPRFWMITAAILFIADVVICQCVFHGDGNWK